jgi:hypothetical protein
MISLFFNIPVSFSTIIIGLRRKCQVLRPGFSLTSPTAGAILLNRDNNCIVMIARGAREG